MTMSDGKDDKTRLNMPQASSASGKEPNQADEGDKTRISTGEEQRRVAAQKKAKELEKRLAAIAAKKNGGVKSKNGKEPAASDKTQLKPSVAPPPQTASDKTQIKTAKTKTTNSEKTQLKPRLSADASQDDSNKTVFKPVDQRAAGEVSLESDDPTTVNEVAVSTPTSGSGGGIAVDRSQYVDSGHELLKNRFVFEKILGAGGMGVVYKAKDLLKVEAQDRDPYVAIKVLSDEFKTHPEAFIALQRESRKTQRIAHPNIVNVHDFDRDGDTVFMTMEYLEGKPLDKLVSQYKATGLPEEDAWKILEGISAALIYAHDQRIIHSDFKPGNIFVTDKGVAKVFDFGIARAVAKAEKLEESTDDKTVFDAGNLGALTPAYASLEMLEGETPDVRDDIYALGCIAYEMFTGNHPFNRVHANEAQRQKLKPKRIPNLPKYQWKVIESALAFKREDRVETVFDFWQKLTHKRGSGLLVSSVAAVLIATVSILVYQNYFAPPEQTFSEDEIRSEIERKVLIEQNKRELAELIQSKEFSRSWERNLSQTFESLVKLLGAEDAWLLEQKEAIYQLYFQQIVVLISQENFEDARSLLENTARYTNDADLLSAILKQIEEAEAIVAKRLEEERQQQELAKQEQQKAATQAKVQKERNDAFDVAMGTVNKQLACRTTINMRDIDIAVTKLRSLNRSRYRKEESNIITKLASCISKIGRSFPERAEEFKKRALRIFPDNSLVANIKIEPKDPCDLSLAGLGARGSRAVCRDVIKKDGDNLGRGPSLVVIPAKGSVKTFAIGKYEITVDDYNKFCENDDACEPISSGSNRNPLTNVDVTQVKQYINWLSSKTKRKYRLPTKTEWVYASRANSSKLDSNRNCRLDSRGIKKGGVLIRASTGQQNGWGLVNYLGNARELVVDGGGYSALGGSFETAIEECVVTKSERHNGSADKLTGFRILREIDSN